MGARAAEKALSAAGLTPADVSCVIVTTMSYLHQAPPAATAWAAELGADRAAAFEFGAACAGFSHGLAVAGGLVASRRAARLLVVARPGRRGRADERHRRPAGPFDRLRLR